MELKNWVEPDTHGWILRPQSDGDWVEIVNQYASQHPTPLLQTVAAVRANGCRSVVVENRYVDLDFRSDHSAYWSHRFDGVPAYARRLHFFSTDIDDAKLHHLPADVGYLGYAVIRPLELGPVGRTLVRPPPELETATLALVTDEITLFGNRLVVEGAPFCQQDSEFFRCAHAAAWMCHYSAVQRRLVARQETATLVEAAPAMLSLERPFPSKGMSLLQLQAVFGALKQPALFYGLGKMPRVAGVEDPEPVVDDAGKAAPPGRWDTRMFSVICRYLNSGYPVLIATEDHAFVIVGWFREGNWIRFVVNDDQRGPYGVIDSPFTDERGTWQAIMVPLPPRVLLSGESAENVAHRTFRSLGSSPGAHPAWSALATGIADNTVSVRTLLRDASEYKHELGERGLPDDAVRLLRLARLPHYVWVVEAHDRTARAEGRPCVIAEFVVDSTSNDFRPRHDALLMPGVAITYPPDGAQLTAVPMGFELWQSSMPLNIPEVPRRVQLAS
jgi:hypothetical protein